MITVSLLAKPPFESVKVKYHRAIAVGHSLLAYDDDIHLVSEIRFGPAGTVEISDEEAPSLGDYLKMHPERGIRSHARTQGQGA